MIFLGDKESKLVEYVKNSYLELNYFEKGSTSPKIIYFPFVGKLNVRENREAMYTEYQPISRNTTLFGYNGSRSRVFTLDYQINADYLWKYSDLLPQIQPSPSKSGAAQFNPSKSEGRIGGLSNYFNYDSGDVQGEAKRFKALSFIDYQINLIRSLPINNAETPTQAPPIVRLNHGLLYQDVPCVCTGYSFEQESGDENNIHFETKVSNKFVNINIELKETRTGDYQKTAFNQMNNKSRDNVVGWEQILSGGSLDPITPIYL